MNLTEIKELDLTEWLENNGYKQIKGTLFENPLRADENPSFSVFKNDKNKKWSWSDKRTGESGNIIDLIMRMQNCTVSEVVKTFNDNKFSFSKAKQNYQKKEVIKKSKIEILKIKEVRQKGLFYYAYSRKIKANLVKKYLKEIHYKVNDKEYYSLAFKNDAKGYEIRNKYSKQNINGKAITTIKGVKSDYVSIFEGFFNFLSALVYFKKEEFENDVIILNSVVLLENVINHDILNEYEKIYSFLDNDDPGRAALNNIYNKYDKKVVDCSIYYQDFNDFNDLLCK